MAVRSFSEQSVGGSPYDRSMAVVVRKALSPAVRRESQSGILLPSQLFPAQSKQAPEYRLMIAVLHEALDCLEKHRAAPDARTEEAYLDARRWFFAEEQHWPYSFERICVALDLDPGAVRRSVGLASATASADAARNPCAAPVAARVPEMDWREIEAGWETIRNRIGEKWGRLTEDDLVAIGGDRAVLTSLLQQRYDIPGDVVEEQISGFLLELRSST